MNEFLINKQLKLFNSKNIFKTRSIRKNYTSYRKLLQYSNKNFIHSSFTENFYDIAAYAKIYWELVTEICDVHL